MSFVTASSSVAVAPSSSSSSTAALSSSSTMRLFPMGTGSHGGDSVARVPSTSNRVGIWSGGGGGVGGSVLGMGPRCVFDIVDDARVNDRGAPVVVRNGGSFFDEDGSSLGGGSRSQPALGSNKEGVSAAVLVEDDDDDSDDNDTRSSDDDDDDSSLEDLHFRSRDDDVDDGRVMGIQAWPGRRCLDEDFCDAAAIKNKYYCQDDSDDDGIGRLAVGHALLSTVFRHGSTTGGDFSKCMPRVVSNDDEDDADDDDNDDDELARKWQLQLQQNQKKEQQWQLLLATIESANSDGGSVDDRGGTGRKRHNLSTIVEEDHDHDDDDSEDFSSDEDHESDGAVGDESKSSSGEDDHCLDMDDDDGVVDPFDDVINLLLDGSVLAVDDDDVRDDNIDIDAWIDRLEGRSPNPKTNDTAVVVDPSQMWLQLPSILPRIETDLELCPNAKSTTIMDVADECNDNLEDRSKIAGGEQHQLLQQTLDCIAALAFCG